MFIRPERIRILLGENSAESGRNRLQGRLSHSVFRGDQTELLVDVSSLGALKAILSGAVDSNRFSGPIQLCFSHEDTVLFRGGSGE